MEGCGSGPRAEEGPPELRDLETKLGRKTPEVLLRSLREEEPGEETEEAESPEITRIHPKIRRLRLELARLRALDVQILQQLLLVNEGIESVKWLLEDRGGPLTSRCSSLTSSQYSLAGSQGASRRGSWSSQPDANDRLDSISIGSFLDTLADDLDEYSLSCSEPALPPAPVTLPPAPGPVALPASPRHYAPGPASPRRYTSGPASAQEKDRAPAGKTLNGPQKPPGEATAPSEGRARAGQGGDKHKLTNQRQLEYEAHWRWVQSQDDVTFL